MTWKAYPKYKLCDYDWLVQVPSGWEVIGLNKATEKRVDYRGKTPEKVTEGVFLVTARNIKNGIVDYSLSQEYVAEKDYQEIMSRGLPKIGDVLFTTEAPLGEVANVIDEDIALAQRIIKFRGIKGVLNNYYLKYWILSECFQYHLSCYATGSTALGLKASKMSYLRCLLPPMEDQIKIVDFLDFKTKQIEILIDKKKKILQKLEEKKEVMIANVVVQGLDDKAVKKDSDIDWLGDIPSHWDVIRLRFLFSFSRGLGITKANLVEEGIQCINYGEIHSKFGFEVIPEKHKLKCVDQLYLEKSPEALMNKGDFVFADTSEDLEGSGNFSYLNSDTEIFAGYHTVIARPIQIIDSRYMAYIFDSQIFRSQIARHVSGVKVFSITQKILKNSYVWLPPLQEQKTIVSYLDLEIKKIEGMIEKIKQAIEKLIEYKSSLITKVVKGDVDVRDVELLKE